MHFPDNRIFSMGGNLIYKHVDISEEAMGDKNEWTLVSFLDNQNAWCEAVREESYFTPWSTAWQTETPSLRLNHRSPQAAPWAKDLRPTCHPRSQCPAVAQTMVVSHRWGRGGPGGTTETPSHHGCHADCFILRTIPHHPGFGKCSWSLLVGCKGEKKPS